VLVAHTIRGEEVSCLPRPHRARVAGLVYLDAAYPYAYYDQANGNLMVDSVELQRKLEQSRKQPVEAKQAIEEMLQMLPRFQKELEETKKQLEMMPAAPAVEIPVPAAAIMTAPTSA
jgi:hypothetical protein